MSEAAGEVAEFAPAVAEPAPAKINLYLHVTGRRPDGYHLIDSLVAFAAVGDEVRAAPADRLTLTADGPFAAGLPDPESNLAMRAARLLAETAGVKAGARINITKRLPVASGVGGGSADAAAVLRALSRLWKTTLSDAALAELGLKLGADVPVCLFGRAAAVSGVGERIEAAPSLPAAWLALVNPGVAVGTKDVFAARSGDFSAPAPLDRTAKDATTLARLLADRHNDLAAPARRIAPVIGEALAALDAQPGALLARMSGSGATCFGLFAARDRAEAAVKAIAKAYPGWWCVAAALRP